ncbi:sensor domain-containing diguanylate cyclase [Pseudoxanthomonas indica]|uniref:sensor domain-containing diguanylate cyclase n=1 Tax=Pseudoxanthomonas indica TaxID=428993 RepID=UPI001115D84D|nr:GGDEF domain-containing protein [Pseudoxanthomonas indica]
MNRRLGRQAGGLLALLLLACNCLAAPAVSELLEQAETLRSSDPARFDALLTQVSQRKQELSSAQGQQLAYLQAYRLAFAGDYDNAIPRLKNLIADSPDSDTRFRAGALLVNIYTKSRQFADGLRQLGDTLVHIDQVHNSDIRTHGLIEAAYIHNEVGQYRLGLHYAERLLAAELPPRTRCFAEYLRYDAMQNLAVLPTSDAPMEEAIRTCESIGEVVLVNYVRTTLARKWVAERKRDAAIVLLQRHLPEVERARYPFLTVQFKSLLGELMFEKGDMAAADSYASETVALSSAVGNTYALVSAYRTLYQVAERRRDDETALVYYRRYAEADKAYLNEVKARELAYQIVRQETLEKSQQIQRLDSQNQLLQLQRKLELKSGQNTRLIIVLLVLLLASIAFWAYRTKRTQISFKRLAETDALTGACNRSHFTQRAERLLAQAGRTGEEVALVMFDLDHFKNINDRHGHAAGDWVLRRVVELGRGLSRKVDLIGRLGGEEFAMLIYACDLPSATRVADECRARIAALDSRETGHVFTATASFGIASTAQGGLELARLMSLADRMLYRAKHEGRNRICVYEGGYGLTDHSAPASNDGLVEETSPPRKPTDAGVERLGT